MHSHFHISDAEGDDDARGAFPWQIISDDLALHDVSLCCLLTHAHTHIQNEVSNPPSIRRALAPLENQEEQHRTFSNKIARPLVLSEVSRFLMKNF